tara:strand:+ start:157 stop:417 length:261 start_codon:yes stop_codon:yes gene_type:complete
MEKQEHVNNTDKVSNLCPESLNGEDIEKHTKELKFFMESFDPYSPLSEKDRKYLRSLNIYDLDDPFKVTNQLISRIEDLIERKQKL